MHRFFFFLIFLLFVSANCWSAEVTDLCSAEEIERIKALEELRDDIQTLYGADPIPTEKLDALLYDNQLAIPKNIQSDTIWFSDQNGYPISGTLIFSSCVPMVQPSNLAVGVVKVESICAIQLHGVEFICNGLYVK